ncbi:hypothetical protein [Desulforegula conservatrix]|uniref:hypothetical protein n=1 Tax=Desulforegula conservatrix TaxID=153026 RepID=UPI00040B0F2B|nr:hypothetical protein [Desulforegula conservatrix]
MSWQSRLSKKAQKQAASLPESIRNLLFQLLREIEMFGPVRGNWPNYSRLLDNRHHCHLKKGKPTYVAVWEVSKKEIKLVEVIYAGTHEKAPY